ncbi:hypothetical protein F898_02997 [Acinetobacter courvalinii]|nr:hypothetical protein F898_02997 [Acinetobacter courvalinii]
MNEMKREPVGNHLFQLHDTKDILNDSSSKKIKLS